MAIASSSTTAFSTSFYRKRPTELTHLTRFSSVALPSRRPLPRRRLLISSRLNSSKSPDAGGSISPDNGGENDSMDEHYELQHGFSSGRPRPQSQWRGSPLFVSVPVDAVGKGGLVRRKKTMLASFKALAVAGVEGVVIDVCWGLVEGERPGVYDWKGYTELVALAERCGLKVRAVFAFHQRGIPGDPGDPHCVPLPRWVLEEADKNPDLLYTDRFGRRNIEYMSLGCDIFPVLRGRTPLQAYADFMKDFRDTFRPLLGDIITGVQVGMGPSGELRYPASPEWDWGLFELGEFHCSDKYMLASLSAWYYDFRMLELANGGPIGTEFSRSPGGSCSDPPMGKIFLEWYSGMLLLHGERICREAEIIFRDTEVNTSAKLAVIPWHYHRNTRMSEAKAGYYNTSTINGYLPIVRMFARYGFSLCCAGFEMQDVEEKLTGPDCSPEGLLKELLVAAKICGIPVEGENSSADLDDESFEQVLKMSRFYTYGINGPSFSFNFSRMGRSMFEENNWRRFSRFVRQLSDANNYRAGVDFGDNAQARLDFGDDTRLSLESDGTATGSGFAYC